MFEHLCIKTEETGIVENQKEEIKNHLYILESKIQRFFPEFSKQEVAYGITTKYISNIFGCCQHS